MPVVRLITALATVQEAGRIFADEVVHPALAGPAGLAQLEAVCEAFFEHLQRRTFPGGCFFAGAALEMGTRPGGVLDLARRVVRRRLGLDGG